MRKFLYVVLLLPCLTGFIFGGDSLNMAIKPMTEQYIIGGIVKKLIEQDTGLKVEVSPGIGGGTSNIQPAMEKGEFDFYPEYTGTGWNMVLKKDSLYNESLFDQLQQDYHNLGMSWLGMLGFNNTFGIVIRKELADKYNLKKISDLAPISDQFTFGAEYDFFEREDGYKKLTDAYGLKFKKTRDMDIGLKYPAINQGKIDVMNIFTTDGLLTQSDVVVLEDDKGIFPSYECGFVIRDEVIDKYPQIKSVFNKLSGQISDLDMAEMNYQVESKGMEPEQVGENFLKKRHLIK